MADYQDIVTRKQVDSTLIRVYPGATVELYESGTATLVDSAVADDNGLWSISSLDTGKYDIKVDGTLVRTIHFVKADHSHKQDETWQFFVSGSISADKDPDNTIPTFVAGEGGSIEEVKVSASHVSATADLTVHLCRASSGGGSAATFAADSAWNYRILPGAEEYRFYHQDTTPGVTMSAGDAIQLGLDYVTGTIEGLTVIVKFRPTA